MRKQKGDTISAHSSDSDSSEELDPDKQIGTQEEFVNKDPRVRTAVRNLRQREETAKYLRNLDPKSAIYDGKSRMMRDNPNPDLPEELQMFKGDNFVKFSGDALNLIQQEAFMVKANQTMKEGQRDDETQGNELNTIAMPSQIEILRKAHDKRK
jgi:pre-mRNA-processing factor SLU7